MLVSDQRKITPETEGRSPVMGRPLCTLGLCTYYRLAHQPRKGHAGNSKIEDTELPVQVLCTILDAWGWCTGTTQRDGMGREEGGGFRMGNTCIPEADSL